MNELTELLQRVKKIEDCVSCKMNECDSDVMCGYYRGYVDALQNVAEMIEIMQGGCRNV